VLVVLMGLVPGVSWVMAGKIGRWIFLSAVRWWRPAGRAKLTPPTRNLFVVGPGDEARALYGASRGLHPESLIVLRNADQWSGKWVEHLSEIDRLPRGTGVVLDHLDLALGNPVLASNTLRFLEHLLRRSGRTVVLLSAVDLDAFTGDVETWAGGGGPEGSVDGPARWKALLSTFTVVPVGPAVPGALPRPGGDGGVSSRNDDALSRTGHSSSAIAEEKRRLLETVSDECGDDEHLRPIRDDLTAKAAAWEGDTPCREEVLEEIATRAAGYYRAIWEGRSSGEKIVLRDLASEGLVNYRDEDALGQLASVGLVRRDPELRVFNRTFARFVLSPECRREIRAIERAARESDRGGWDRWRMAFWLPAAGGLLLFLTTQAELLERVVPAISSLTSEAGLLGALIPAVAALVQLAKRFRAAIEEAGAGDP
jgi:hypothetical protein